MGGDHLYGRPDEVVWERGHLFHTNQCNVSDARNCMGHIVRGLRKKGGRLQKSCEKVQDTQMNAISMISIVLYEGIEDIDEGVNYL